MYRCSVSRVLACFEVVVFQKTSFVESVCWETNVRVDYIENQIFEMVLGPSATTFKKYGVESENRKLQKSEMFWFFMTSAYIKIDHEYYSERSGIVDVPHAIIDERCFL